MISCWSWSRVATFRYLRYAASYALLVRDLTHLEIGHIPERFPTLLCDPEGNGDILCAGGSFIARSFCLSHPPAILHATASLSVKTTLGIASLGSHSPTVYPEGGSREVQEAS